MAARGEFVTTSDLARAFNLTNARITQLVKEGMPSAGRDRYDYVSASVWYIRFLQQAVKRREMPGGVGGADALRKERAAAMEMETELKRIALRRARGELVPVAEVVRMFESACGTFKVKMLSGVSRAGSRLMAARTQGQAIATVEAVLTEALGTMSQIGADWIESNNGHRNGTSR